MTLKFHFKHLMAQNMTHDKGIEILVQICTNYAATHGSVHIILEASIRNTSSELFRILLSYVVIYVHYSLFRFVFCTCIDVSAMCRFIPPFYVIGCCGCNENNGKYVETQENRYYERKKNICINHLLKINTRI